MNQDSKERQEIDMYIEQLASSGLSFRKSIGDVIYQRLHQFFHEKGKEISRDTTLQYLFSSSPTTEWEDMRVIGLNIPEMKRAKMFNYVIAAYLLLAIIGWIILLFKHFELLIVIWGLPVTGTLFTATASPLPLFMAIFKKKYFPCETIGELIEEIISSNWSSLLYNDKELFKRILKEENYNENSEAKDGNDKYP